MPAAILIIFITRQQRLDFTRRTVEQPLQRRWKKGDVGGGISIDEDGKTMASEGAGKMLKDAATHISSSGQEK